MLDLTSMPGRPADRSEVTDALRVQILATEHWSLLATRTMSWNEAFSRASMFLTVLSAAVVALALVAQVTAFGPGFRIFALLVLPVVVLVGLATFLRLGDVNNDDAGLVIGMNRLRHAYLELAPELAPYFVTGHHDDETGIWQTYGLGYRFHVGRLLASTPALVGAINVVVVGVLGSSIAASLHAPGRVSVAVGVVAALAAVAGHGVLVVRSITHARRAYQPRFPSGQRGQNNPTG